MNWIQKLERKIGKFAIPNLMTYIIILNVAGFVIVNAAPEFYYQYLQLSISKIMQGEVWRIFTFLLDPPASNIIGMVFFCLLYYSIGHGLENTWGTFRFNLYYFSGILFHIIAAFVIYFVFHMDMQINLMYLNLSLFLAFGAEFPEYELNMLFLVVFIPIKVKWLALIDALMIGATIVGGFMTIIFTPELVGVNSSVPNAVAAGIAIGNFLIYFFNNRKFSRYSPKQMKRRAVYKKKVKMANPAKQGETMHVCAICKRTKKDYPDLEFRFCSKCEGAYEYCQDHLYTHKHVTKHQNESYPKNLV